MSQRPQAKNVLLIVPPSDYTPAKGWTNVARAPMEGAVIASAVVERRTGLSPRCLDLRGLTPHDAQVREEAALKLVRDGHVKAVCLAGIPGSYTQMCRLAEAFKVADANTSIIVGGVMVTTSWEVLVDHIASVDYWLVGECERSLASLLKRLAGDSSVADALLGVVGKRDWDSGDKNVEDTRARLLASVKNRVPLSEDLFRHLPYHYWTNDADDLSDPTWKDSKLGPKSFPKLICYSTQRGCRFNCSFCANRTVWPGAEPSLRPDYKIRDDLTWMKQHGVESVYLNDPTFNQYLDHAGAVARAFGSADTRLPWTCTIRATTSVFTKPDQRVPETKWKESADGLLELMSRNGCKAIFVGIETADRKLLNKHKCRDSASPDVTKRSVRHYVQQARKYGLEVEGFFVVGLPGESVGSLRATRKWIEEGDFIPRANYFIPLPGSDCSEKSNEAELEVLKAMSDMRFGGRDIPVALGGRRKVSEAAMRSVMRAAVNKAAIAKNSELVREAYDDWLGRADDSRGLLFASRDTAEAMEVQLRELLSGALVFAENTGRRGPLSVNPEKIGRIIVHGYLPDLLWSSTEAYRPVDHFFGRLHKRCRSCLRGTLRTETTWSTAVNILKYVPPYWEETIRESLADRDAVPPCWAELHPDKPNVGAICQKGNDRSRNFGEFTVREVYALSRMRLRSWAVKKREFLRTPATSVDPTPVIKLMGFREFDPDKPIDSAILPNIVLAANRAEQIRCGAWNPDSDSERVLDDYLKTFASDAWRQVALVEADPAMTSEDAWLEQVNKDRLELKKAFELDTECCSLPFDKKDAGEVVHAVYNLRHQQGLLMVYFEVRNAEWAKRLEQNALHPQDGMKPVATESVALTSEWLPSFCRDVILPWHGAFRDADQRWENHEAFRALFPSRMADELIGRPSRVKNELEAVEGSLLEKGYKDFALSLRKANLLYRRRVLKEEDSPVRLALSTMSEIWQSVYGGALEPHYSEFQRFQHLLKDMPGYRDHLTHSIQVFLLGERILDHVFQSGNVQGDTNLAEGLARRFEQIYNKSVLASRITAAVKASRETGVTEELLRYKNLAERAVRYQWALASLMHDFAVPASKSSQLLSHLFDTFLGVESKPSRGVDTLKAVLSAGESKYRAFIHGLLARTATGVRNEITYAPVLGDAVYQRLTEDHGFLSAVYLFNQLFESVKTGDADWWQLTAKVRESVMRQVFQQSAGGEEETEIAEGLLLETLDAIVKHNAALKEHRFTKKEPPSFKHPSQYFSASESLFGGPVAGLLLLCDTLCDWGRMVYPDELWRHDALHGRNSRENQNRVARPECAISDISEIRESVGKDDGRKLVVTVNYEWRLPYAVPRDRTWCLYLMHKELTEKMKPYAPGFQLGKLCADCKGIKSPKPDTENCSVAVQMKRFWKQLAGSGDSRSRLRFPDDLQSFRDLRVEVKFYGESLDCALDLS